MGTAGIGSLGGKGADKAAGKAAKAQSDLARMLIEQSGPLRSGLIDRSTEFIAGGDVMSSPQFLAFKDATGDQFSRARENVISSTPAGGALTSALTNLEGQKASTLTQGAGSIYEDELSRALALGTGITGMGQSGLSAAAQTQAARAAAEAEQNAAKYGAIGSGAGAFMGVK